MVVTEAEGKGRGEGKNNKVGEMIRKLQREGGREEKGKAHAAVAAAVTHRNVSFVGVPQLH